MADYAAAVGEINAQLYVLLTETKSKTSSIVFAIGFRVLMCVFEIKKKSSFSSSSQVLNLHGNGLLRLRGVSSLLHLSRLVVSFNDLSRLDDIAHLTSLEKVDASFNRINSLEGLRVSC